MKREKICGKVCAELKRMDSRLLNALSFTLSAFEVFTPILKGAKKREKQSLESATKMNRRVCLG